MKKILILCAGAIICLAAVTFAIVIGIEGYEHRQDKGMNKGMDLVGKESETDGKGGASAGRTDAGESAGRTGDNENARSAANLNPFGFRTSDVSLINKGGKTVMERILVPEGFERIEVGPGSYGDFLRNLPVKPHGSKVRYYNGGIKPRDVYEAVLDIDVGDRDLQQCADAVIRLRAEYLYQKGLYDRIHFNFTNGFRADYSKWMEGYRIYVDGNTARWVKQAEATNDYSSFRRYLDMVFAYAGTLSLSQEMERIPLSEMRIGDIFLKGDDPGHCVIILDIAVNKETGEKRFIIAQSYMPAQDIHILKNPANQEGDPWYTSDFGDRLKTPEWEFTRDQLYRFREE